MEIIIGRDQHTRQLCILKDGNSMTYGQAGSVPMDVSRQHISLQPVGNGKWIIKNLNERNVTFVNGIAIGWEAYMEEQPFRIQLRPVRKEDQIQILFSVTLQDGTGYSILTPDPAGEDPGT